MRTTGYEKPASFRSNTEPESVREVGTGGNEMEAMRAQQEKFEPSPPPPSMINLSPSVSSSPASKSWSELSQSEHHSKSATLSQDASEPVQGGLLEGSGGKSWGEVRSDAEGGVMLNPLRSQLAKGAGATLEKVTGDIGEENEYRSGKDTPTITKEKKEEKVEAKSAQVKEKEDTGKKSETEEEKLEPERTMEGLAESSEETNSLQAFRAVERFSLKHFVSKLPFLELV